MPVLAAEQREDPWWCGPVIQLERVCVPVGVYLTYTLPNVPEFRVLIMATTSELKKQTNRILTMQYIPRLSTTMAELYSMHDYHSIFTIITILFNL